MTKAQKLANDPEFRAAVLDGASVRDLMRRFSASRYSAWQGKRSVLGLPVAYPAEDDDTDELDPVDITPYSGHDTPEPAVKVDHDGDCLHVDARGQGLVKSIDDLVREAQIDLDRWRVTAHQVKTWTSVMKGPDDLPRIVRNWGVTAKLEPNMVQRARADGPRVYKPMRRASNAEPSETPTCLIISDPQIGFRRRRDGQLVPMHDRRALDILLQMAAWMQPDVIVCLGDALDLAEWSTRFPRPAELRDTTQPSLAELHWWLAAFRATCPTAEIVLLEGNHDARIRKMLVEKAPPAATVSAVGEDSPRIDLPGLLHLDALGVEYVGPYPTSWWLWGKVEIKHGDTVRSKPGATVGAEVQKATHSMIMGHVHRSELASRTVWGPVGPRTIFASSVGCTCRIGEGVVPGVKPRNDWQQAWGLVSLERETAQEHIEQGLIVKGRTLVHGRRVVGVDHTEEIAQATGFPMAVDWLQGGE